MAQYYEVYLLANKHTLGALLQSRPLIDLLRRNLKNMLPQLRLQPETILYMVRQEVLRRLRLARWPLTPRRGCAKNWGK